MFRHIVYSLANRQGLFAYVRTCKNPTWYNNQVHGCCNIAVQSCYFFTPWQHVLSCMDMAVDLSWWFPNNVVQACSFIKPWTVCSNMHEQACQQPCSSWPAQPWTSLSTTMFKLASSTMLKPVNNHVQAGQFNHEQACQQPCSSWQLNHVQACQQPCSSWQLNHVKACQQEKTSCAFLRVYCNCTVLPT